MRHVHPKQSIHRPGYLRKSFVAQEQRVGGGATNDHSWTVVPRQLRHMVVVDLCGLAINTVVANREGLSAEMKWRAVAQMAAVRQIHGQDAVSRLQQRMHDAQVRDRGAHGLNVGMLATEQLYQP